MRSKKLYLILLLGLILRLLAVSTRPIWYDEAFAVLFSEKGLPAMILGTLGGDAAAAPDVHPLLYYTLLWGWMRLFGESLVSVRALSILIGLGTLLMAYLLSKELFDEKTALFAALFVALSPFHIHYSQEIRMYSLLAFELVTAAYALWKGMHSRDWRWWVLFSLMAASAQYTNNLAFFFLVPLAATPLLKKDWPSLRSTVLAGLGAVLLYSPWLVHLPNQFSKLQGGYWISRPGIDKVFTALLSYVTNLPLSEKIFPVALFIALFLFALAVMQTLRLYSRGEQTAKRGLWLAYLAFTMPALLWLVSQWQPLFIERALLPSGVMFSIWLAWAITGTGLHKAMRYVLFGLLLVASVVGQYQHLTYHGFPYGPYQELGEYLEGRVSSDAVIVHSNKLTHLPTVYYFRDLPQEYVADPPGSGSDTLALPTQEVLGLFASPSIEGAVGGANTVWLVIFSRAIDEYQDLGQPTHPHLAWLDENLTLVSVEPWGDLLLYEYER
jgi:mannosyltransferase